MKTKTLTLAVFSAAAGLALSAAILRANDEMFPPAPAAKPYIDFDGEGFSVNGQREFIGSGSIHFTRVPHELWRDRLLKLKRMGFNTVQTYVFWNDHEPKKGQFDFTGDRDLGKFLDVAKDVGLYATVRVGPYVCAEWDSGGFPVWLRFEKGVVVRQNQAFEDEMKPYFDKLLPIVAAHQINRGGNVILVQLENEHPRGWGTEIPNPYFQFLLDEARKNGIEVPDFFSGVHHGHDTAAAPIKTQGRTTPWYSTETWINWYDQYGGGTLRTQQDQTRWLWNIAAHGGDGFNIYMFHGGTNFDYFNDNEDASSYDYGTLVGQDGDLRPTYYVTKRLGLLTQSFPEIFAHSQMVSDFEDYALSIGSKIAVHARKSDHGAIVFIESNGRDPSTDVTLQDGTKLTMDRQEIVPLLVDMPLDGQFTVGKTNTRTLALAHNGNTTTWVVYLKPGDKGTATITGGAQPATLSFQSSDQKIQVQDLTGAGRHLRVIALTPAQADKTWMIGNPGSQDVVIGPDYLGDYSDVNGRITATFTRPYNHEAPGELRIFNASEITIPIKASDTSMDAAAAPEIRNWQGSPLAIFTAPATGGSDTAPEMGSDGDASCYALYHATAKVPQAGPAKLSIGSVKDNCLVYVNGAYAGELHYIAPPPRRGRGAPPAAAAAAATLEVTLKAGENRFEFFVSHHGRDKAYNFIGDLDTSDPKGLRGDVTVAVGDAAIPLSGWTLQGGVGSPDDKRSYQPLATTADPVPTFFRSTFDAQPPAATGAHPVYRVTYTGLSRGSIWLNGHNLGRYPEKIQGLNSVYLPECWIKAGVNELAIFDEKGQSPSQVKIVPDMASSFENIAVSH